jgi:hypothetical protein
MHSNHPSRRLILIWLSVCLPMAVLFVIAVRTPGSAEGLHQGLSPIYTGIRWLRFHSVNAALPKDRKHVVVLGASNMAGWGDDYRWMTRQKTDLWGRYSFPEYLQKAWRESEPAIKVSNLAVNGARFRSQFFLYLYTLEKKPDLIVWGLSKWTFIRDGDFRDPEPLLHMNSGVKDLLSRMDYEGKGRIDSEFLAYLQQQPSPAFQSELQASKWDERVAWVASGIHKIYSTLGLPHAVASPAPSKLRSDLLNMVQARDASMFEQQCRDSMAVFGEMVDLFPKALPLIKKLSESQGVRLVMLIPPCPDPLEGYFLRLRKEEMEAVGLEVLDLSQLSMDLERETFDGSHFTRAGNERFAREFLSRYQAMKESR